MKKYGLIFLAFVTSAHASVNIQCYRHLNRATRVGDGLILNVSAIDGDVQGYASSRGWSMSMGGVQFPPQNALATQIRNSAQGPVLALQIIVADPDGVSGWRLRIDRPFDDFPELSIFAGSPSDGPPTAQYSCMSNND